jgi:3-hydroxybutyryl-CoA dehydrogenase
VSIHWPELDEEISAFRAKIFPIISGSLKSPPGPISKTRLKLRDQQEESMAMEKIMVVGAGLMGSGIAQVCAQSGVQVFMNDAAKAALDKAVVNIRWSVRKFAEKGKLSEDPDAVMKRIYPVEGLEAAGEVDLVIEAVFEEIEVKREIFRKLDEVCGKDALIASNTSAIPITELASVTRNPARVLGMHFFSPVPLMQLVEVIRGTCTSDQTMLKGMEFVVQIGKEPIMVNRDIPGFVINRINLPSTIEAMKLVEEGVATPEDIDKGLRLAAGRKMGIFETGDMVGLDVTFGALMAIYKETGDPRFYPPLLLRRKVKAGHLGRKTGKGWYEYNEDGTKKSGGTAGQD